MMTNMIEEASTSHRSSPRAAEGSEQLTLLPTPALNPRFLLSKDTRERGMRHVAEIRQMLAEPGGPATVTDLHPTSGDRAA